MSKTLEERLNSHSNAFDGLLSLIPAKYYFDQETKTQWNRKKQSKEQARLNKRAKLDPESLSSALDVQNAPSESSENEDSELEESEEDVEDVETEEIEEDGLETANTDEKIDIVFDDEGNKIGKESSEPLANGTSIHIMSSKKSAKPKRDSESIRAIRDRLASRINELREKRKAPGTEVSGAPLNREAILKARRERQDALKNKKKRKREEEDERQKRHEQEEDEDPSDNEDEDNSLLFSQVKFGDGRSATADLKSLKEVKKKKGPRDLLGQLRHIQAKNAKLSALDEEKKSKIQENSQWSKAILQAEGGKVLDDEKLIKKFIKQQQKRKKKSGRNWQERRENVAKGIKRRQSKREENLALRREMKNNKGKKKQQKKKKASRAGFEGRKLKVKK